MYRYSRKSLIKDLLSIILIAFLLGLSFLYKQYYWAVFVAMMLALLVKDYLKISRMELVSKPDGLYRRIGDKERLVFGWKQLHYITRTRKFKHFVMLADDKGSYFYLKPTLEGREQLLKEIVLHNLSNKKLAVDQEINLAFKLGLQLDGNGKIRNKQEIQEKAD